MPLPAAEQPEVWLRGPVDGVSPALQPVAHALLQALEDVERELAMVEIGEVWTQVYGVATIGFHVRHMAGSLDRLMTYARGEGLSEPQRAALAAEKQHTPDVHPIALLRELGEAVERALAQVRGTPDDTLDDERRVGRAGLPSTVRGLLVHAGEHCVRHAGQVRTTARIVIARRTT